MAKDGGPSKLSPSGFKSICALLVIVATCVPANAQPDSTICCLKAARENWNSSSTVLPWDSCAFGASYISGSIAPGQVPQVTATMSFCKQACPGYRLSNLSEWLLLLTTWVIPAIALLIICSTGECERADERQFVTPQEVPTSWRFRYWVVDPLNDMMNTIFKRIPYNIVEFTGILGDPASAIRGAFSEIALDVRVVSKLSQGMEFDKMMKALAMVAGQTKFDENTEIMLTTVILSKALLVSTAHLKPTPNVLNLREQLEKLNDQPRRLFVNEKFRDKVIEQLRPAMISPTPLSTDDLKLWLDAFYNCLEDDMKSAPIVVQKEDVEAANSADEHYVPRQLMNAIHDILHPSKGSEISPMKPNDTQHEDKQGNKIQSIATEKEVTNATGVPRVITIFEKSEWAKSLRMGIKVGLKGRVDFMKALVVPVALGLVATAGSFYTAYTTLGDNDTAHSLAYGTWYSWIIVLAVASNCYIATANPGLVKLALQHDVYLSDVTVPLRERAHNTRRWTVWLKYIGCETEDDGPPPSAPVERLKRVGSRVLSFPFKQTPTHSPPPQGIRGKTNFLLHLILKQFAGWLCIALPCACAASISYTTPTVGLGCRSFNHLLYGVLTLAISAVAVTRAYLSYYPQGYKTLVLFRALYIFGLGINNIVLIFGTLFHLIGLYRSCFCAVLGVSGDFLLQISAITALDVANAKKFWLPVGYMDFGFVWLVCCIAVGCRGYIHFYIKLFFEEEAEEE
ncbi:hypothetical protein L207DRAFT_176249 [Hyaloscypha variabilis F]|uniref:Uncharacterized protein n=1 Tax=Hyaloscypha variabilis (strain UAMH 11265 / GT02V1 / F) TaxID=1149755 RepID=A0A2J6R219_HYAVF|nr:hypothetical protein L207DRAFT_176249 [Hyaloscypha variabilis F]